MYMAVTFFTGLLYSTFFLIIKFRKQDAFTCTAIVHALYNLFAFAMKYFNKKNVVEKPKAPTPDEFKKMTDAEKLNEWRKK